MPQGDGGELEDQSAAVYHDVWHHGNHFCVERLLEI